MQQSDRVSPTWGLELAGWWKYYNELYLDGALREPVIRIVESRSKLGTWDRDTRTLSVSEHHIARDPWLAVMETLRHEMAHQYAHEVLQAWDERPHGSAFAHACERLRVDQRASGRGDEVTANREEIASKNRIIDKVHKLLSLSSSPNEHEAQVAVNKARELLLRHNIETVDLAGERRFGVRWLGPVRGRHHHYEMVMASILGDFFFVSVIWTHTFDAPRCKRGTVLSVYGEEANLDMAEYVYEYLEQLLGALWRDYKTKRAIRGDRDRLTYFSGVLNGFHEKLTAQDRSLREKHALVWSGDPGVEEFLRRHHPRIRTSSSRGSVRSKAYEDGVEAGRSVTLRRPVRGSSGGRGGYLTAE